MVASLLVAPRLSTSTTVSLFLTARLPTRRCLAANAVSRRRRRKVPVLELPPGHHSDRCRLSEEPTTTSTERSNNVLQASSGKLKPYGVFLGIAAAASSILPPCGRAWAAPYEPPCKAEEVLQRALQEVMVVGDLDPATAKAAIGITGPALSAFGFLFIVRIVMSWYPKLPVMEFPYVIAYAPTEPFLEATRKVIPPVGGVDVTPVVWFGLVSFLNEILVGPQGLLVLLSQQV